MKKITSILLLVILLLLGACGDNTKDPDDDNDEDDPIIEPGKDYEVLFSGDWNKPGLYEKDGTPHQMPEPIQKTGLTLNVLDFGAKADDPAFDNYNAFKSAIESAQEGDSVYVPEGTFYFTGNQSYQGYYTHIILKSGIIFEGAGKEETILVSQFSEYSNENRETSLVVVINSSDIVIKNMAFSGATDLADFPDPDNSNIPSRIYTSPKYLITVDTVGIIAPTPGEDPLNNQTQSHNVVITNVLMEKFQRMALRLRNSREVTLSNSTVRNAVDLAGGGAGYGVSIQGTVNGVDWTETTKDTLWNVIKDNEFVGPYIRHAVLIQYYAHNNYIYNNSIDGSLLDAIDMHGEDEYSNEISHNTITNTRAGAAFGVGNTGASHDAAGRNNYFHHNIIDGGRRGIDVILGSPRTIIVDNVIKNLTQDRSIGITLSNAPYTYIMNNQFENVNGTQDGYGIKINYSFDANNPSSGIPNNIWIKGNSFTDVKRGVFVETHGENFILEDNTFTQMGEYEVLNTSESFVLPERSTLMDPVVGANLTPTDINFITTEAKDLVQAQKNMKFKSSYAEPQFNRMIYAKFDLSPALEFTYSKVYLSFTAKAQYGTPTINFHGSTTYTQWDRATITWNNSLLHDPFVAAVMQHIDHDLTKIFDFTFPIAVYEFNTYYVEITDYITNLEVNVFTMIISDDDVEEIYMEIYNDQQVSTNQHFRLIFV